MRIERTESILTISLQEEREGPFQKMQSECPVDLDGKGEIIGIEIEAPRHTFGRNALKDSEFISLQGVPHEHIKTPKGRTVSPHAYTRPPYCKGNAPPWVSYEEEHDMMYIYVSQSPTKESTYKISIPVNCEFSIDAHGRICRIDVPLDKVQIGFKQFTSESVRKRDVKSGEKRDAPFRDRPKR